jgi:hypothetical protein
MRIVRRMLVGGEISPRAGVDTVRRLNKTVIRQLSELAVREELAKEAKTSVDGSEDSRFIGALLIVIVDLGGMAGIDQAAVNAFDVLTDVKTFIPTWPKEVPKSEKARLQMVGPGMEETSY